MRMRKLFVNKKPKRRYLRNLSHRIKTQKGLIENLEKIKRKIENIEKERKEILRKKIRIAKKLGYADMVNEIMGW